MTKRKGIRTLAALALCFALCISFTVPAFAYADDTEQELPVTEATQPEATPETAAPEEPEPYEGEPIEGEGNAYTRDLLYDKATNKQFITVQTKTGNTFYVVIDYDAPINEEKEQYQTYFLNMWTRPICLPCWMRKRHLRLLPVTAIPAARLELSIRNVLFAKQT